MEGFFVLLTPPVALALMFWAWTIWLSFRADGRNIRRSSAAVSAVLAICGAIAFLALTSLDDYNDYPGHTCSVRDGFVPVGSPPEQLPPPPPDVVSTFHPSLDWSHRFELLPLGVRCTYWIRDDPRIAMSTHSPWPYSVCSYGALVVAFVQAIRVVNPDLLRRGAPPRPARAGDGGQM